jgi:Na+/proline symporter
MQLFTSLQGTILIFGYGVLMWLLVGLFAGRFSRKKLAFLVADRKISQWPAAFSIAATWIWAPALFLAAQKAYQQGIVGVFWFTVPNVACLIIFAYFAEKVRDKLPDGFTISGYVRKRLSARCQNVYLLQLLGLATCSFAVQLLAGGVVIAGLTGISFLAVTVVLALIALSYSWWSGIRSSIMTDYAQMVFIALIGFTFIPWAVLESGGWSSVVAGLYGRTGTFNSLISGDGGMAFWSFGIPVTIGLLAGPFGDQSFWQRAFSIKEGQVKGAFIKGAVIFATVPILMSLLGFIAAGKALTVKDVQLTNLVVILEYLPRWTVVPFTYMLLSGLVSTLDSNLCAIASLTGHDVFNRKQYSQPKAPSTRQQRDNADAWAVQYARSAMLVFCLGAVVIANLPGMKILYLFLFYGTLRASTLLPTVILILKKDVSEPGVFWGIVSAIAVGLPIFAYGKFTGNLPFIVFGSIFTVGISGTVTLVMSKVRETARVGV